MAMRRVHVTAAGRVQGVFYRASTHSEAERLGLTGWVRNLPDGRVDAEFQGGADAVERILAHCRAGPPHAEVEELEVSEIDPADGEAGFEVR